MLKAIVHQENRGILKLLIPLVWGAENARVQLNLEANSKSRSRSQLREDRSNQM